MGTSVYRLRKKHKECDLMGIYPVRVMALDYGFELFYPSYSDPDYKRYYGMRGCIQTHARNAAKYYLQLAILEHGTSDVPFYFAFGGLVNGAVVYKTVPGHIPEILSDEIQFTISFSNLYENVGMLQKLGRRFVIDKTCLKHQWDNNAFVSDFRDNNAPMVPARVCNICSKFEYLDSLVQTQYQEYLKTKSTKYEYDPIRNNQKAI